MASNLNEGDDDNSLPRYILPTMNSTTLPSLPSLNNNNNNFTLPSLPSLNKNGKKSPSRRSPKLVISPSARREEEERIRLERIQELKDENLISSPVIEKDKSEEDEEVSEQEDNIEESPSEEENVNISEESGEDILETREESEEIVEEIIQQHEPEEQVPLLSNPDPMESSEEEPLQPLPKLPSKSLPNLQRMHPASPRDPTPITIDGVTINRQDIPPIPLASPDTVISKPKGIRMNVSEARNRSNHTTPEKKRSPVRQSSPRDAIPQISESKIIESPLPKSPGLTSVQISSPELITPNSPKYSVESESEEDSLEIEILTNRPDIVSPQLINSIEPEIEEEEKKISPKPFRPKANKGKTPVKTKKSPPKRKIVTPPRQSPPRVNTKPNTKPNRPRPPRRRKRNVQLKKKRKNIPNYSDMSPEEQARWHADFNVKLGILREAYPDYDIPSFDDSVPLEIKHQHYERYVQQVYLDNSVGNYKVYLLILFAIIELFCVKILGLDMGGYTLNQLTMMNKYERLLVELGEKSYSSVGSEWPVEARIIMLALFNGIVFLVVRLFASYLGPGIGDVLQNIVNAFLTKGDADQHIKKAQGVRVEPDDYADGVPEPPVNKGGGGFDLGSLINGLGGILGGNSDTGSKKRRQRAARAPTFRE